MKYNGQYNKKCKIAETGKFSEQNLLNFVKKMKNAIYFIMKRNQIEKFGKISDEIH